MLRRTPRSTLFPTRRSSDLAIFVLREEDPVYFTQIPPIPTLDKYIAQFKQAIDTVDNEMFVETTRKIKEEVEDRKSTRLNSSHSQTSYAVFCLKQERAPGRA